jgi:uncharacterized protein
VSDVDPSESASASVSASVPAPASESASESASASEPASPPDAPPPEPIRPEERVESLDIIRGFALFGVLLGNLQGWFRTYPLKVNLNPPAWPGTADVLVEHIRAIIFDAKFFSLFSMLFGAGLAIQMERAEARTKHPYRLLLRRLGILFGIGAAHIVLIWMGDILCTYAVAGLLLLAFLRRKVKTVAIWCACLFALPLVLTIIVAIVQYVRGSGPGPTLDASEINARIQEGVTIYGQGDWLTIARFRIKDYFLWIGDLGPAGLHALAMFLIGLIAWKRGILKRPSEHIPTLKKTIAWGLIVGVSISVYGFVMNILRPTVGPLAWFNRAFIGIMPLAITSMALLYGAGILLLLQRPGARARLAPLGSMGRMALTNYLLQSVLCSFIFYGFGLGLYDKVGPAVGVLIVIAIYTFELFLSRFWMRRFRFGPVEWLWRSLTYWKMQPMRLAPRSGAA